MIHYDDVKRLADNLPDHVKLIVDGAYRDFQEDGRDMALPIRT